MRSAGSSSSKNTLANRLKEVNWNNTGQLNAGNLAKLGVGATPLPRVNGALTDPERRQMRRDNSSICYEL